MIKNGCVLCDRCGAVNFVGRSSPGTINMECDASECDAPMCNRCCDVQARDAWGSMHFFCSARCRNDWIANELMLSEAAQVEHALGEMGEP